MTNGNSPPSSARSGTLHERPVSSRSSARSKLGYATMPPVNIPKEKLPAGHGYCARDIRPTSAGNVSVSSARSNASGLTSRLKSSPYAVPLSARNYDHKQTKTETGQYSHQGLQKSRTSSKEDLAVTIPGPVLPPKTPPSVERKGLPTPFAKDESEISLDKLLDNMLAEPTHEPSVSAESPLVEGKPDIQPEPLTPVEEDQVQNINLNSSIDMNAMDIPVLENSLSAEANVAENVVVEVHASAESSVYCDNTLIGSIPDDVGLPSDLSPLHIDEGNTPRPRTPALDEVVDSKRLESLKESPVVEPRPTPADSIEPAEPVADESLTQALLGMDQRNDSVMLMDSPQASPIAIAPLNLSVSSTDLVAKDKAPASSRSVQVTARFSHDRNPTESPTVIKSNPKKKSCWCSIFGCH